MRRSKRPLGIIKTPDTKIAYLKLLKGLFLDG